MKHELVFTTISDNALCCDHEVSKEEYDAQIKKIQRFLNGDVKTIKDDLAAKMNEASERLDFEKAMDYRDQIKYIEATVEKQNIMNADFTNRDVFSYVVDRGWISIQVFLLRQSTIIKREAAMFPIYDQIEDEVLSLSFSFMKIKTIFFRKKSWFQKRLIKNFYRETLGVKVITPKRGSKKRMLDLATQNSEISLNEKFRREEQSQLKTKGALEELSEALGLEKVSVIESLTIRIFKEPIQYLRWWSLRMENQTERITVSLK